MSREVDSSLLHAWFDNEVGSEQRAEVEAWLNEHPEEAAEVRLWEADAQALRAQFDPVAGEPVPARLSDLVLNRRAAAWHLGWQRWAAGLLLFASGGLLGALIAGRAPGAGGAVLAGAPRADWVQRAAVAHAVYVPEVRHPVEVRAQEAHLAGWLTKRLDLPVKLYDLRDQGFQLVGGRLLPDASGPSAQLMYEALPDPAAASAAAAAPVRVTVYLRKPDDDTPAAFRFEQKGTLNMFYWVEGRSEHGPACGYALVGALPRERLLALAEAISHQ